jgi:hypothetical protein
VSGLDAASGSAVAADGVLLDPMMLAVGAGVAGAVDAGVPVGGAGSADVGVAVGAAGSGRLVLLGGGIAIAVAALLSGTVSEVEFSVEAAMRTSPSQPILHSRLQGQFTETLVGIRQLACIPPAHWCLCNIN